MSADRRCGARRLLLLVAAAVFPVLTFGGAGKAEAQQGATKKASAVPLIGADTIPPVIYITPLTSAVDSQVVPVTLVWCDNKSLILSSRNVTLNGLDITSTFSSPTSGGTPSCPATYTSTGTITLRPGQQADTLVASIYDNGPNFGESSVVYSYNGRLAPPAPVTYSVSVTPDGDTDRVTASGNFAVPFVVRNTSQGIGTSALTFTLTKTCSGTGLPSGCSVFPSSMTLKADSAAIALVAFTAGSAGTSGAVKLKATLTTPGTTSDSGTATILPSTLTAAAPTVNVDSVNPGTLVPRELCEVASVGDAADRECGDLQVAHALPAVRSMNKARAPTLLYNSQQAHPYPVIAANVSLGTTTLPPDTLVATLHINGVNYTRRWPASAYLAGTTRRVAVAFDANALPTGMYPYTVTATTIYNASHSQYSSAAMTDTLLLVNRAASAFGAGWWLAGLEQLSFVTSDTSRILWVGGDGSARLYARTTNGKWAARATDSPDTLALVDTLWVRYAPHGTQVQYNRLGQHVLTVNRQHHTTRFAYSGSHLVRITFPTPTGGSVVSDTLEYSGTGYLQTVVSPGPTATGRTTTLSVSHGRLVSVTDPDTTTVSFTYDSTSAADSSRLIARTDKLGHATTYSYDATHHLAKDSLYMGTATQSIVRHFRDPDSVELATGGAPVVLDSVYVGIDGPRTDVKDVTHVWLNRFGAPTRILDALGHVTTLAYADARWPGLVTQVQYPNGRIIQAVYSARGNDSTTTDEGRCSGATCATTRYIFDPRWDYATRVVQPMGDSVVMAYDTTSGNLLWAEPGGVAARKVKFGYDAATELLDSVLAPLAVHPSLILYDHTLGNDSAHVSGRGIHTSVVQDLAGRVVQTVAQIDSGADTADVHTVTTYDLLDRMLTEQTFGPQRKYAYTSPGPPRGVIPLIASPESVIVARTYDAAGHLLSLSRRSGPDSLAIGTITTQWRYDIAGRTVKEIAPSTTSDSTIMDSTTWDPAGNPVVLAGRRHNKQTSSDSAGVVSMSYDAIGRMVSRTIGVAWRATTHDGDISGGWNFPFYTVGYFIPADVETFAYDVVGDDTAAVNANAHVSRTFNEDGTIATDTLRISNSSVGSSTQNVYGLEYAYDLDGRRTSLTHPATVAPVVNGVVKQGQSYTYDAVTGNLASVTDVLGNTTRYTYDLAGRLDTIASPGGMLEYRRYNDDNEMVFRVDSATLAVGQTGGSPRARVHRDSLIYDGVGRILESIALFDTTRFGYSALGHLLTSVQLSSSVDTVTRHGVDNQEVYVSDALGNRIYEWQQIGTSVDSALSFRGGGYEAHTGRQEWYNGEQEDLAENYDIAGNATYSTRRELTDGGTSITAYGAQSIYYDALGRVRVTDKRGCKLTVDGGVWHCNNTLRELPRSEKGYFSEYAYDALGRRVLVRARSDTNCDNTDGSCYSTVTRTVYDGDQVLYEIQVPGGDQVPPAQMALDTTADTAAFHPYGRVVYTHGLGLDQPADVIRIGYSPSWPDPVVMVPHSAADGGYDVGSFVDGHLKECKNYALSADSSCIKIDWPEQYYGPFFEDVATQFIPLAWFGSLIEGRRDASGQIFLRNRYYDPNTGRFTQEDPLGLAGGLNAYGYANGDPVDFSDPFGLTCKVRGNCTQSDVAGPAPVTAPSTGKTVSTTKTGGTLVPTPGDGPEPDPSPFGRPALERYEKRREIHFGGMVLSANNPTPAFQYEWNVAIYGEPRAGIGTLRLQLQRMKNASMDRIEFIYSGQLEIAGKFYDAQANLYQFKGTGVFYGYIDARP